MSPVEEEFLRAIYELAHGRPQIVPYDDLAERLDTTFSGVKSISGLLQVNKLAIVTFGGVQLTNAGLEFAKSMLENSY